MFERKTVELSAIAVQRVQPIMNKDNGKPMGHGTIVHSPESTLFYSYATPIAVLDKENNHLIVNERFTNGDKAVASHTTQRQFSEFLEALGLPNDTPNALSAIRNGHDIAGVSTEIAQLVPNVQNGQDEQVDDNEEEEGEE